MNKIIFKVTVFMFIFFISFGAVFLLDVYFIGTLSIGGAVFLFSIVFN